MVYCGVSLQIKMGVKLLPALSLILVGLLPETKMKVDCALGDLPGLATSLISSSGTKSEKCGEVECEKPPGDAKCSEVPPNDTNYPKPKGKNAECCPLWKCTRENEKGHFTFHGISKVNGAKDQGGTEIVKYSKPAGEGGAGIGTVVSSVATGTHDAIAIAGDGAKAPNVDEMMKEFSSAFKLF